MGGGTICTSLTPQNLWEGADKDSGRTAVMKRQPCSCRRGQKGAALSPAEQVWPSSVTPAWLSGPAVTGDGRREQRAVLPTHHHHLGKRSIRIFRGGCGLLLPWSHPRQTQRGPRWSHQDDKSHKEGHAGRRCSQPRVRQMEAHPSRPGQTEGSGEVLQWRSRAPWQLMSPN